MENRVIDKLKKSKCIGTILIAICTIVCFVLIVIICRSGIIKRNYTLEAKGELYLYSGQYDKAIEQYSKIITKNLNGTSKEIAALKDLKMSEAYSIKGDNETSKKYINLAKSSKSNDPQVLNNIVFNEFMNGRYEEALNLGEEALKNNPKDKRLIKTMFGLYLVTGKKYEAKRIIKMYDINKSSSYDVAEYAGMLISIGDMDGAVLKLKQAWDLDKDEYKIYDVLSQAAISDNNGILNSIKKFQQNNLMNVAPMMWIAKIYSLNVETCDEAENLINDLKNKDVGDLELKLIEVTVLQKLQREVEAEKILNNLMKKYKNDYRVQHSAGWFYLNKGQVDLAEKNCLNSMKSNPNYVDNHAFLMPEILKKQNNTTGICACYRKGLSVEPYNFNIINSAANHYLYTNQKLDKAIEFLKFASNIRPLDLKTKYNMALAYFDVEKNEEASEIIKKCIELDPNSVKYHRALGAIYLSMNNQDGAMDQINKALKLNKDDILSLNNAACYYVIYTNDFNKAYNNLNQAVKKINAIDNEKTKKIIKGNFENVKSVIEKIESGKANETIKIPDLRVLY